MRPQSQIHILGMAAFFFLLIPLAAHASQTHGHPIELSEGPVIQGEMRSFSGGVRTVHFSGPGTLPFGKHRSFQDTENKPFVSQRTGAPPSRGIADDPQLKKMQEKMMQDPETVRMIENLQNDPAMQKILNDPELMRAVQQGDLNRLMQDPKIMDLMKNKKVEQIIQKNQTP